MENTTTTLLEPTYRPRLEWNTEVYEYLSKAYGHQHFAQICNALIWPAIQSCVRVNTLETTTAEVIRKLRKHLLKKKEVTEEATGNHDTGTTRKEDGVSLPLTQAAAVSSEDILPRQQQQQQVPAAAAAAAGDPKFEERNAAECCFEHELLKNVVLVRGKGPCNINYKIGKEDNESGLKEVVVSRKCGEAVLRGAHVFVPGVLACSGHVERGEMVAVSVAVERPDGAGGWCVGVTRGTTLSSQHANSQFEDTSRSGWFIGTGRAMMTRASLFRETKGVAVEMVDRVFDLPSFNGLLTGDIFLQNLPSVVAAHVLDPKPGERILDMCAAPGGKTTAIAMLMEDKGEIIALDRSHNKVSDIVRLSEEMKLTCIHAMKMDALKSVLSESTKIDNCLNQPCNLDPRQSSACVVDKQNAAGSRMRKTEVQTTAALKSSLDKGAYASRAEARKAARRLKTGQNVGEQLPPIKGFCPRSFDRVLLDAPCSALGLRPRLFAGQETLESLRKHSNYQRRMLDQAVQLVRPGGTLVYSTCTLNPGENEAVVRYALDTYPFLSLAPQHPRIGGPGLVGGQDVFDGSAFRSWLREGEQHMVQRFDPSGPNDTIGFFIAKFAVDLPVEELAM
ncbi:unnamed protein product [Sphagnum jensenii]|uniref:SAM-dependent MTase RsmB/NOP-type domain-containing protein n=1 Tax=Sphagnum jensenii TaxID=128206 RepID=A0ABP1BG36_9BRYO